MQDFSWTPLVELTSAHTAVVGGGGESNATSYATFFSRSDPRCDLLYEAAGNAIETHEYILSPFRNRN
ncbi:MAG: hypothetical protein DME77_03100 [Verrucomicrobia bacterium]|nr:MAG: hypothetical protein DME77_03100 [Verrucomicrobiota bacterium]